MGGEAVEVDDRMRDTGVDGDWLYAVGDVNGRVMLTHMGKYQARIAADVILGRDITAWADERVFRFEFPERPGALLEFLGAVGARWNISLFHYRNHGADRGRVLAGIQVDARTAAEFDAHVDALGFHCVEETANPAYRAFL